MAKKCNKFPTLRGGRGRITYSSVFFTCCPRVLGHDCSFQIIICIPSFKNSLTILEDKKKSMFNECLVCDKDMLAILDKFLANFYISKLFTRLFSITSQINSENVLF